MITAEILGFWKSTENWNDTDTILLEIKKRCASVLVIDWKQGEDLIAIWRAGSGLHCFIEGNGRAFDTTEYTWSPISLKPGSTLSLLTTELKNQCNKEDQARLKTDSEVTLIKLFERTQPTLEDVALLTLKRSLT